MAQHIKLFLVDGQIVYIHHNTGDPSNDDPGNHTSAPSGDQVRFKAPVDGGFQIQFKKESPFINGEGGPGQPPISSPDGSQTGLLTLKDIKPAIRKRFPYTATLANVTDDPELIVDNSGGTSGTAKKKGKRKR